MKSNDTGILNLEEIKSDLNLKTLMFNYCPMSLSSTEAFLIS